MYEEEIHEKDRKRAVRRYHYQRLKKKRSNYWGYPQLTYILRGKWEEMPDDMRAALATTSTPCSCYMCGNPRRYWKQVTLKERKKYLNFVDDLKEVENYYPGKYTRNRAGMVTG